jgi:glycosyltransferase involved in cell wall biosynthesis
VVADGESGLLFPVGNFERLADRLLQIYRDKELRERLGRQALTRVTEQFSLDSMIRKYEEMYGSLAERQASGRPKTKEPLCRPEHSGSVWQENGRV